MAQRFYADLHLHSRFSRATSRDLDLEHLAFWARKKGLTVIGTGDFTHPGWMAEIKEKLVPAEPGLFRLREDLERELESRWGAPGEEPARFLLEVEISTIYKKDDKVRKVHHLIYAPDLESADRLTESLARIGNIASDGRPILGLDSRHLLEITLEAGKGCYLIPAHIWTPWFSVFGSKSGFDAIRECYGDLSPHIFALETGLSSDPPMNWMLSALDGFTLVSNSDAHSPSKLGREACLFETDLSYHAIKQALETRQGFGGTVEFFPEEGKYHMDGHRGCHLRLTPEETRRHDGRCPVCHKPLTIGVMHRVMELADRDHKESPPPHSSPYHNLIPLSEIISEIEGVGPKSKTVQSRYESLLGRFGAELHILNQASTDELERHGAPLLAEALSRMREGQVISEAGYDGEYGTIRLFTKDELHRGTTVGLLFELPDSADSVPGGTLSTEPLNEEKSGTELKVAESPSPYQSSREEAILSPQNELLFPFAVDLAPTSDRILDGLDPDQKGAAEITKGPLLVLAGPGTGKTRTLTHRIAYLITDQNVPPEGCLALTFTKRAAEEMRNRLDRLIPIQSERVPVMTIHSLGLLILREQPDRLGLPLPLRIATEHERIEIVRETLSLNRRDAVRLLNSFSQFKRAENITTLDENTQTAFNSYERAMRERGWVDFDDLIILSVKLLKTQPDLSALYRKRFPYISIDEYQDVDAGQFNLIRLLAPSQSNICVIGDPDQAIYRFRGADVRFFQRFREDYPEARTVQLTRNYRSTRTIVEAATQMIAPSTLVEKRQLQALMDDPMKIEIHRCSTARTEAQYVVLAIERLIGGVDFHALDTGRVREDVGRPLAFSDFAVLYRTDAQSNLLREAFAYSGIPFQKHSHDRLTDHPYVQKFILELSLLPNQRPLIERLQIAARALREKERQEESQDKLNTLPLEAIIGALRPLAENFGNDTESFLNELTTGADIDLWDPRADRVSLLTLHASKGLEFSVVFIVGCEDGLLPLNWEPDPGPESIAEERRLFFVGMTRARNRLFLSYAGKRRWRGSTQQRKPSPFLKAIKEALIERHTEKPFRKTPPPARQLTLF